MGIPTEFATMFVGYIESLIPHVGWMNSGAMRTVTVQVLTSVPPRWNSSISPTATYLGLIRSNSDTPDPRRMIAINGRGNGLFGLSFQGKREIDCSTDFELCNSLCGFFVR